MKTEKRKIFEKELLFKLKEQKITSECDECSQEGILIPDPYCWEIHECIKIKSLCKRCEIDSIQSI